MINMIKVTLEVEKDNGEIELTHMELENIAFAGTSFGESKVYSGIVGAYSVIDKFEIARCLKEEVLKEVLSGDDVQMLEDLLNFMSGGYEFD